MPTVHVLVSRWMVSQYVVMHALCLTTPPIRLGPIYHISGLGGSPGGGPGGGGGDDPGRHLRGPYGHYDDPRYLTEADYNNLNDTDKVNFDATFSLYTKRGAPSYARLSANKDMRQGWASHAKPFRTE